MVKAVKRKPKAATSIWVEGWSTWKPWLIKSLMVLGFVLFIGVAFYGANSVRQDHAQRLVDDETTPAGTSSEPVVAVEEPKPNDDSLTKIREMRKFYLAADRADGKIELRTGGNSTWRHHNPGKMIHGDFTRMMGAIGSDGKFAVFTSYERGRKAMEAYLFTDASEYRNQSLTDAFKSYASQDIIKAIGVPGTTKLADLTSEQKNKLLDTIQSKEGWMEGKVTIFANEEEFKEKGW